MNSGQIISQLFDFESALCRAMNNRSNPVYRRKVPFLVACTRHLRNLLAEIHAAAQS